MSRDNHMRSRSRSISRYRNSNYNNNGSNRSPPVASSSSAHRYSRHDDQSPPLKRYQRERSRSMERNGHKDSKRRKASPTDIRRKNPEPSKVLGVFNLHVRTSESEIRDVFERFGPIDEIIMVKDAKTRSFRGYCFIYYNKQRDATEALTTCNGIELKERMIRVDYSLSERPHISTPGEYRGKRGRNNNFRSGGGNNSFNRPRHYSPMRNERTRYYDRYDNDRRNRSMERTARRMSPPNSRDDFRSDKRRGGERPEKERHHHHHRRESRDRH